MVRKVLKYYFDVAMSQKRYSIPPLILAPIARIGTDYVQPLFTATIINKLGVNGTSVNTLAWLVVGYFAGPFLAEILWRYLNWLTDTNDALGMEKIANATFAHLLSKPYDFHANNFAGALVAKASRFINAFAPLYDSLVMDIAGTFVGLIFATVVLFRIALPIGIVSTIIYILFGFVIVRLTKKRYKLNKQRASLESLQTAQFADSISNAISVKTFARERHEEKLYKTITKNVRDVRRKTWNYKNIPIDLVTTNTIGILNTVALIGGVAAVRSGATKVGTLVIVLMYVRNLTRSFWDVSRIMRGAEDNISNAVEMMQVFEEGDELTDKDSAKSVTAKHGNISFEKVTFSYGNPKQEKKLFENLSLSIPAGQAVGLVGPSGGGKTTITKLLLRFMDVRDGHITIDGQDISGVTQSSLRDAITYVPQEPLLFHRSLKENIAYGRPTASMKEIIAAAKKAHAHEFIEQLADGYDTLVGERGVKLSGGQRQRVAIARAILKNAPIIVLDEATSALDSESEQLIQQALSALMEGRTAIVIAHRLSTIKHLDRILVLDDGKITEDGSHDELIKQKDGTYAKLWAHQSGGFIK